MQIKAEPSRTDGRRAADDSIVDSCRAKVNIASG